MSQDPNPFVHPAQTRLLELIDQAEREILGEQEAQPMYDPLERYHTARGWGVDPWVAAMLPVSWELNVLQDLAVGISPDETVAKDALMSVVKHSLQALVLFEEDQTADQVLDDSQLADFLARLVGQLDTRIGRLRAQAQEREEHREHVHYGFDPAQATGLREEVQQEPDPDVEPGLAFTATWPATVAGEGNDGTPALAYTAASGSTVAGEGSDGTPAPNAEQRQVMTEDEPGDEHDDWQAHADVLDHSHDERRGRHHHDHEGGARLVIWEGEVPPVGPGNGPGQSRRLDLIRPEEVPADTADHDFRTEDEYEEKPEYIENFGQPPDLDGAERALARESAQLRLSAAGSSATQLGGRHASPANTDPDMTREGKH